LAAVETCPEKRRHEVAREGWPDDFGAKAEDVHVVVLDALVGGIDVMADGRADPRQLAGGNRCAHTGTANEDSTLGLPAEDRLADRPGLVRVIDSLRVRIGAQVHHEVSGEHVEDCVTEMDATVVECDRHLHVWTVPHRRQSTRLAS
ncbi:MAG: hypothetical protein V7645_527, partial [Actinomycetota bacterium]